MTTPPRNISHERRTGETTIAASIGLDGDGSRATVATGLGFLDHMMAAVARHGRFDLTLRCEGDLHVDDHHTVEDCALVLGKCFDEALGDRRGIRRFAHAYAPLDEALARVVVDFSGRPWHAVALGLQRTHVGDVAAENLTHFFQSFAITAKCALHVDVLKGENDHHRAEAAFKAFALALREAVRRDGPADAIPSTKGVL
jgi:imidazoleglycerol phosphate dehydratase HisB